MDNIINFDEHLPHKVSEVICLNCFKRWIAVRPTVTKLTDLECPQCREQGFVIETGEDIDSYDT